MSSKIEAKTVVRVDFSIQLTLNEQEAKALEAIAGYGVDSFHWDVYAKMRSDSKGNGIRLTITEINCEAAPTIADCVYHLQVRIADVALAVANNSGMDGGQQE